MKKGVSFLASMVLVLVIGSKEMTEATIMKMAISERIVIRQGERDRNIACTSFTGRFTAGVH
ncbi:MAG: hypothetical protein ACFFD4_17195 [Candidatus Odinarchaeota archaeon]